MSVACVFVVVLRTRCNNRVPKPICLPPLASWCVLPQADQLNAAEYARLPGPELKFAAIDR